MPISTGPKYPRCNRKARAGLMNLIKVDVRSLRQLGSTEFRHNKKPLLIRKKRPGAGLLLTRSVPYAINRFFAGVFCVPNFIVNRSCCLIDLAFGLKVFIGGDVPRDFLALANNFIY
jgi:hypothetical protein